MEKFTIEMLLPPGIDPSTVLEKMMEVAKELAADNAPEDDEGEPADADEEALENGVSVAVASTTEKVVDFFPTASAW